MKLRLAQATLKLFDRPELEVTSEASLELAGLNDLQHIECWC